MKKMATVTLAVSLNEGVDAFWSGADKSDCPYKEGTDGQYGWLKGWRGAELREKRLLENESKEIESKRS
jgi:ribosome modulation factor